MPRIEGVPRRFGLKPLPALAKRSFDVVLALALLTVLLVPTCILVLLARRDTGLSGIFQQERIGLFGDSFVIYKIRSMKPVADVSTTVTTSRDPRITSLGAFLRRTKMDEFPQLLNVLNGTMSFVGPRPDVADVYQGIDTKDLKVLTVRPGITGPSSIAFRNEEEILSRVEDPEKYNTDVLFPEKIRINLDYIDNYSFWADIKLLFRTVFY